MIKKRVHLSNTKKLFDLPDHFSGLFPLDFKGEHFERIFKMGFHSFKNEGAWYLLIYRRCERAGRESHRPSSDHQSFYANAQSEADWQ